MIQYPDQRTSRQAKEKDDFYKPTYDHLINKAVSLRENNKATIKSWLEAANGKISSESLNYLVSPIMDVETKKTVGKLPGEIRDTDLINMVRERNMGEYLGLPYKFTVLVHNPDSVLRRDLEVREEVNKLMQQALINLLNEYYEEQVNSQNPNTAINTGMQSKELPDIEKFREDFLEKWIDTRAIQGKNILELINSVNDFDNKRIQSFFYWWATEEFYTYREIINNEVYTSIISPLEGYPIYNNEEFVEDFNGFVIRRRTTLSQVKALYWNQLDNKEKEYIKNLVVQNGRYTTNGGQLISRMWDTSSVATFSEESRFDVTDEYEALDENIIIWRTEVPVKIRIFTDMYGNKVDEVVPDDYKLVEGIDDEIKTEWIEEVYIGRRFGNEDTGIYLKPKPCDVQRYDKHKMTPKLPVGGKKGILRNIVQNPISKRLTPFVIIDRMLLLQQERTMAKYQGYIQVIPQSMLRDDSTGTKNEKLFYIKADNTLVYDDTQIDFNTVAQGFRVIGMPPIADYLKVLIDLRDKYKSEALEIANMNNYRLGDVAPSTGKGVMQESIYRASLGNVLAITMFHAALERDHLADLEFSKIAYQDEKRGSYIDRSSGKPIYVDINIKEHLESDYGVFLENAKIDQAKIDMFKQLAFNASQNGDIDSAVAAIEFDSVPELRKALKEISDAKRELDAQIEQARNDTSRYVADKTNERQEAINETTRYVAEVNANAVIESAKIRTEGQGSSEPDIDTTGEESKIALRRDELEQKRSDDNVKNDLKERQLNNANRLSRDKLALSKNKSKDNK